jgi:WD40 repeat protein
VSHDRLFYCSSLAIYVYRLKDYSLERIITGHTIAISTIRASLFNPIIATSALDQTIRFWDVASGKCIKVVNTSGDFKPFTFDLSYATHAELACGGKKGIVSCNRFSHQKVRYDSTIMLRTRTFQSI